MQPIIILWFCFTFVETETKNVESFYYAAYCFYASFS